MLPHPCQQSEFWGFSMLDEHGGVGVAFGFNLISSAVSGAESLSHLTGLASVGEALRAFRPFLSFPFRLAGFLYTF